MTTDSSPNAPLQRNLGVALLTLIASSGTLVCCVLPAMMVSLGAGAALAGLVTAVPQLVWLSQHKGMVFGVACVLLALSGALLWRARRLPCPTNPAVARTCERLRRWSIGLWLASAFGIALGAIFAFVLPAFGRG